MIKKFFREIFKSHGIVFLLSILTYLYTNDLRWGLYTFILLTTINLSVILHEIGHIIAIKLCGLTIHDFKFNVFNSHVTTIENLKFQPNHVALIVSSAGIILNFLIGVLAYTLYTEYTSGVYHYIYSIVYLINFLLTIGNMVPLTGSDGYNILTILTRKASVMNRRIAFGGTALVSIALFFYVLFT